ncbi:hypothetical protein [Burkholderia arboris]|uniref:hypothetical protein n=1 Tax=Burkholderia arboris TaxID=488730 RepID=UPI001CF325F5|nr:hypothetical protein [Burkholderia arboris]MCA8050735.1 hypothetical protein [Burkholderia arboris]
MKNLEVVRRDSNGVAVLSSRRLGVSIDVAANEAVQFVAANNECATLEFNGAYLDIDDRSTPNEVVRVYRNFIRADRERDARDSEQERAAGDFEREIASGRELVAVIESLPEGARIVTDVGVSMFSGWGDIKRVRYHSMDNALELIFD